MIAVPRSARPMFGRWRVCRPWWVHTNTLGPPLLIDKTTGQMRPYMAHGEVRDEWRERVDMARQDKRLLRRHPLIGQMSLAALFDRWDLLPMFLLRDNAFASSGTMALDSNYVAGTSGDANAARLHVPSTKTLNTVYFFVSSYTGTAANVNDLNLEVRPESSAGANTPDTATLTDSATKDPASATGWIAATGFTASLTGLSRYFIILGDADGNGTDYATILARSGTYHDVASGANPTVRWMQATTTGGWASGNAINSPSAFVLKFSDNAAFGSPFSAATAPASDTNRRGLRITASALTAAIEIFGVLWTSGNVNISGGEVWTGDTGPSGTADNVSTDILYTQGSIKFGFLISGGGLYSISALSAYSIVATYSGVSTAGPQRIDIGTGEDATLRLAMPGAGELYYRRANGTTDWTNDLVGSMPAMALLLDGQVAAAGGGGRTGLVIGGG